jgi:hypothetical protein
MAKSETVMTVGAVCFGVTVGFITYRALVRTTDKAAISDLAVVIGAIGGGAVTALFNPNQTDLFGWYSIGLVAGVAIFFLLYLAMNGRTETAKVMSGTTITGPGLSGQGGGPSGPQR